MPTSNLTLADTLLDAAHAIDRDGLWTETGAGFADPTGTALDVPAAVCKAINGRLPLVFTTTGADAAATARRHIAATPGAMDALHALATRLDPDWSDDPVDRLAYWPTLPGITPAIVTQAMRDAAHILTLTATAPMAA